MKEKRDREEKWGLMLEKSFSFARKTGGKSDVMEFLEKMSELRHAKKVRSLYYYFTLLLNIPHLIVRLHGCPLILIAVI